MSPRRKNLHDLVTVVDGSNSADAGVFLNLKALLMKISEALETTTTTTTTTAATTVTSKCREVAGNKARYDLFVSGHGWASRRCPRNRVPSLAQCDCVKPRVTVSPVPDESM
ncbi:uncharacterized protein LOC124261615 [Haliotis rubra]|uniref:uncharacterized protein LOC124261615 n=1 Tax=Haliotis rubra TaxID=36100 RepID=UPI001EE60971|nr:uncharacterized protein LOC124261615 [Haliotis rubra]